MREKILLRLSFLILAVLILSACNETTGNVIVPVKATSCDGDNVCEARYNLSIGTGSRYLTISTEDNTGYNRIYSARALFIKASPMVLETIGDYSPITMNGLVQINNRLAVNGSIKSRYLQAESGRFEESLYAQTINTNVLTIRRFANPNSRNASAKQFACITEHGIIVRSASPCNEI